MGYRSIYDENGYLAHGDGVWKNVKTKYIDKYVNAAGNTIYRYSRGFRRGKSGVNYRSSSLAEQVGNVAGRASGAVGNVAGRASGAVGNIGKGIRNFSDAYKSAMKTNTTDDKNRYTDFSNGKVKNKTAYAGAALADAFQKTGNAVKDTYGAVTNKYNIKNFKNGLKVGLQGNKNLLDNDATNLGNTIGRGIYNVTSRPMNAARDFINSKILGKKDYGTTAPHQNIVEKKKLEDSNARIDAGREKRQMELLDKKKRERNKQRYNQRQNLQKDMILPGQFKR